MLLDQRVVYNVKVSAQNVPRLARAQAQNHKRTPYWSGDPVAQSIFGGRYKPLFFQFFSGNSSHQFHMLIAF